MNWSRENTSAIWRFVLLVLLVLLVALPVLSYPMGRDQGMYANIGRSILQGGTPFVDMWDIKPPPIYYLYAAGIRLFGASSAAIRAIDFALVPLGMAGLYLFGSALRQRSLGAWAALLYGLFYFNEDFPSLTQNDSLVTVPMIWAAYAALRAMHSTPGSRRALLGSLLTGLLSGIVLWFKHYFAFFVLALVVNQVVARWQSSQRGALLREGTVFALGGLLSGGTLLLLFWAQGMVQEMLIVAQGTAAYNAQGYDFQAFLGNMANYWRFRWQTWHGLLILVLLWLPLRGWQTAAPDAAHRAAFPVRLVLLWLASALAFALIQAKGFDTHWIPMLPPMALLGAGAVVRSGQMVERFALRGGGPATRPYKRIVQALVLVVLLGLVGATTWGRALPYLLGQEDRVAYYDRFQANDLKPEQSLQVVRYLRERVPPGDTIFIWGFRPEVSYLAQLRPATRFQAHFPLVAPWYPLDWRQENVDYLWAALPPYVLVLEDDYMPWVTDRQEDSHTILQDYTELNNWLIANYERVDEIGDFLIWRRQAP